MSWVLWIPMWILASIGAGCILYALERYEVWRQRREDERTAGVLQRRWRDR